MCSLEKPKLEEGLVECTQQLINCSLLTLGILKLEVLEETLCRVEMVSLVRVYMTKEKALFVESDKDHSW